MAELSSLEKGLVMLRELAASERGLTVAELASATGLNRTTIYRLGDILRRDGWLAPERGSGESTRLDIGPAAQGLAILVTSKFDTRGKLDPLIEALAQAVSETVHVGVLEHADVVHVASALPPTGLNMAARIGSRGPAHAAGLGKALLAALDEEALHARYPRTALPALTEHTLTTRDALVADLEATRARGYALDDEEAGIGVACVAAPVFGPAAEALFAISVTTMPQRLTGDRLAQVVEGVRGTAAMATAAFGGRPPTAWPGGEPAPGERREPAARGG